MFKRLSRCLFASFLACSCILPIQNVKVSANTPEEGNPIQTDYKLYPKPHSIQYMDGDTILHENINVVYDKGIDQYTQARLNETAKLKNLNVHVSDAVVEGDTNILVGIYHSSDVADTYIRGKYTIDGTLFDKNDSYFMKSDNGIISILGKDTDSGFYGLTTLYQILAQMDSYRIRNFEIHDYADVKSRGFIEGYYGNPWSVDDRVDLMKFGGYYKMNAYFYAPKDDPKHNSKWRDLYTDDELKNIEKLAQAGNESKCRYVFALHPFMSNPLRFDTEDHYQQDLHILQAKFKQVIDHGARQIAILDDDASIPGGKASNSLRLLNDMTNWLKEVQKQYPDMKTTLPFVPNDYGGTGTSSELQTLKQAPDNVQIVMTGGKVWGEVSKPFTDTFTNNMGKGPFLWINWPCSDGSKNHLIMGGNTTFLHPNVNPQNVQGIMLNPMQESEPSKVAIFANASYSWNIWTSNDEANQAWDDSFAFVDHNSAIPTEGSNALRELSKHMMNQNMDSRVTPLQESVELNKLLEPFKKSLDNGTATSQAADALIQQFTFLQKEAKIYRSQAGNLRTRDQIVYWLDCWDDTTTAAIAYLRGVKASLNNDASNVLKYMNEGKTAFQKSKTHGFHYIDHSEYAEIGVQHIVPFVKACGNYLSDISKTIIDPNAVTSKFITNRSDNPIGDVGNVFDGKDATKIQFQNPNTAKTGDYVGVMFNQAITVHNLRFLLGDGKNRFDMSKLQYTADGNTWQDLNSTVYTPGSGKQEVKETLSAPITAKGIRLIATRDNVQDMWLDVYEISVNTVETQQQYVGTLAIDQMSEQSGAGHNKAKAIDGDVNTEAYFAKGPYTNPNRDTVPAGATITLNLDGAKPIGKVYIAQGYTAAGDVLRDATLQYKKQDGTWVDAGAITNAKDQTIDLSNQGIVSSSIRIKNNQASAGWWRLAEFQVFSPAPKTNHNLYTDVDGVTLKASLTNELATLENGTVTLNANKYVGIQLNNIKEITSITGFTPTSALKLQTSKNQIEWTDYQADQKVDARYIRVINTSGADVNVSFTDFTVNLFYLGKPKLLSCTTPIAPGWGNSEDMRPLKNDFNIFDGKLGTGAEIGGFPRKDDTAVFDLGQTRNFSSFRYYVVETQLNYLRDGVFEVADRPDAPADQWHPILTVGDGVENSDSQDGDRPAKQYSEFTHDRKNPGNMYKEATGLHVSGRYLRLRITAANQHRAIFMNELQINDGEYATTESNKDVVASTIEEKGKISSNMFDGDINTVYKPSTANGNFIYTLSDPKAVKTIRFVQNGTPSDAIVEAEFIESPVTFGNDANTNTWVNLGVLNQSVSEFNVPTNKILKDIRVTWTDTIPQIAEIISTDKTAGTVNKATLAGYIDHSTANWTTASLDAYNRANVVGKEIVANNYASQVSVDMAAGALKTAIDNASIKADTTTLRNLVANKKEQYENVDEASVEIYSNLSYAAYEVAYNNALSALNDADNINTEAETQLRTALNTAVTNLKFSSIQSELSTIALNEGVYAEADYTVNSYQAYKDAKQILHDLVNSATAANPKQLYTARGVYMDKTGALVNVATLKPLVADFDNYSENLYVAEGYQAYKNAVTDAKALLINGTKEQIDQMETSLPALAKALVFKSTVSLQEVVQEVSGLKADHYTHDSYQALKLTVDEAKKLLLNPDNTKNIAAKQAIVDARNGLVDIQPYKHVLEQAKQYKASDYTANSYQAIKDLTATHTVEALQKNGTTAALQTAVNELQQAFLQLTPLAKDLKPYRDAMKKMDAVYYTHDSYAPYLQGYNDIMALPLDNTSLVTFQQARDDYEKALHKLVISDVGYTILQVQKIPANMHKQDRATLIKAAQLFDTLSSQEQAGLSKDLVAKLKNAKQQLALLNHTAGNVMIDKGLPWYVEISVSPLSSEALTGVPLTDIVDSYTITLHNIVDGSVYTPTQAMTIAIKTPESNTQNTYYLYQYSQGKANNLNGSLKDGVITFTSTSLSPIIITAKSSDKTDVKVSVNTGDETQAKLWLSIGIGAMFIGACVVLLKKESFM